MTGTLRNSFDSEYKTHENILRATNMTRESMRNYKYTLFILYHAYSSIFYRFFDSLSTFSFSNLFLIKK